MEALQAGWPEALHTLLSSLMGCSLPRPELAERFLPGIVQICCQARPGQARDHIDDKDFERTVGLHPIDKSLTTIFATLAADPQSAVMLRAAGLWEHVIFLVLRQCETLGLHCANKCRMSAAALNTTSKALEQAVAAANTLWSCSSDVWTRGSRCRLY